MTVTQAAKHRDAELAALHERTSALHLYEFWSANQETAHEAVTKLQRFAHAVPHIWKYSDVLPCLEKAGELIDMHDSERRSLIMVNPALGGQIATTTTMFAAYPLGVRETRFDYQFVGIAPLDEARRKYYDPLAAAFRVALEEDFANFPRIQRGLDTGVLEGIPLNYQEVRIRHFHKVLGEYVGAGGGECA